MFYSIFAIILANSCHKGCFSIFALLNQSFATTGVFRYFCPYSNQSLPQMVFLFIFALFLTKALIKICFVLFCPYSNLSPTKKGVFFPIFALILTKTLPKRVLFSFCPHSKKKPYQKACFTKCLPFFTPKPCHKGIISITVLILAIALPIRVFFFSILSLW